uniref:U51-Deinotoxin-Dsu1a_1 n=1 Tax=Deinopis subrufa TaxID=1905329 RepID=A0A4Q8KBT1_DEISU
MILFTVATAVICMHFALAEICPDGSYCNRVCCKSSSHYRCCKHSNGVCCTDGFQCCPHGELCISVDGVNICAEFINIFSRRAIVPTVTQPSSSTQKINIA